MPSFADLIATLFAVLRKGIDLAAYRHPAAEPLLARAHSYAGRIAHRFQRLYTLWQAGKLPPHHPARPRPDSAVPSKPRPPSQRLPRRWA